MVDEKIASVITGSGILILFTALLFVGDDTGVQTYDIYDEDLYTCVIRDNMYMPCDNLSTYYKLPNGKCWNKELGNKLCRSGWETFSLVFKEENQNIKPYKEPVHTTSKETCYAWPKEHCESVK